MVMLKSIELHIAIQNAAFADAPHSEVARILRELAQRMENEGEIRPVNLVDVNGNVVGALGVRASHAPRGSWGKYS